MWVQRQGVHSTKTVEVTKVKIEYKTNNQRDKSHNRLIAEYDMQNTMYTYQTDILPHRYSYVNRYHMIIHDIDNNST